MRDLTVERAVVELFELVMDGKPRRWEIDAILRRIRGGVMTCWAIKYKAKNGRWVFYVDSYGDMPVSPHQHRIKEQADDLKYKFPRNDNWLLKSARPVKVKITEVK